MQEETPLPDVLPSSLTHCSLAAQRDCDTGLHGLSLWITQPPVYWSQSALTPPLPSGQGHKTQLAESNIHTVAQRKWRAATKRDTELQISTQCCGV